jgi:hypothetical protein
LWSSWFGLGAASGASAAPGRTLSNRPPRMRNRSLDAPASKFRILKKSSSRDSARNSGPLAQRAQNFSPETRLSAANPRKSRVFAERGTSLELCRNLGDDVGRRRRIEAGVEPARTSRKKRYAMSRDTTVVPFRQLEAIDDPLSEVAREGACRMLAQVLIAEADAFVARWKDLRLPDGRDRVVRHGHGPQRTIQTGIGPVEVRRAKVRDRGDVGADEKIRFTSSILPKWARRTKSLDALLPILYLRGVSTGDFQEARFPPITRSSPAPVLGQIGRSSSQMAKVQMRGAAPQSGQLSASRVCEEVPGIKNRPSGSQSPEAIRFTGGRAPWHSTMTIVTVSIAVTHCTG